ncbi:RNA polymerase sigma factor [Paraburkholderia silviterrae]|uniref:RNA polymerase sigma factor n=1 Tax=Paraburkholderia silviterrae TaxID=2528715 RepID=A0A4R5MER8_9BURK|nr:RNA polymerase sigma factor [Paraburkholderia silviterrae]TDG25404.1 RNA polymerase sigma factor [Paraburkholderia silviterrae]
MGESANGQDGQHAREVQNGAHAEAERSRRFQALALPHLDAAYNLARWLSRNPGDAEDIVQEAFLRAFRFFDTFRGEQARPWLLAIVRRVWYDEWRRRAGAEEVAPFDELRDDQPPDGWDTGSADPEALAIRAEDARRVQEALQRLPVEYREVLVLRELEEMGYREIATVIDVPMGTVMSRLARGRRRLAALLAVPGRGNAAPCGSGVAGQTQGQGQASGTSSKTDYGESSKAWRPSGRGPDGRFREEPAVDGGPRGPNDPLAQGPATEAPDEL